MVILGPPPVFVKKASEVYNLYIVLIEYFFLKIKNFPFLNCRYILLTIPCQIEVTAMNAMTSSSLVIFFYFVTHRLKAKGEMSEDRKPRFFQLKKKKKNEIGTLIN